MAEEKKSKGKKEENEVVLERVYNVPLRKEWLKAPKYKRSKKAIIALKQFVAKHMKAAEDSEGKAFVKIERSANMAIWKDGIKNPPHHLKIKATKDKEGVVRVELEGAKLKERIPKAVKKARAKAEKRPKVDAKLEEELKEVSKKVEDAKTTEKEEVKELKEESKVNPKEVKTPKVETEEKKVEQKPNAPQNQN
jgi:large subunit ribosomal protein L31e|tara:strand:+ start:82 stop:663 length:582 start_codon:yes stop_codon:yes gene_type:complete